MDILPYISPIQGLDYIHSLDLVHLDIKPDNVFLTFPEQWSLSISCLEEEVEEDTPTTGTGMEDLQLLYKIGLFAVIVSWEFTVVCSSVCVCSLL